MSARKATAARRPRGYRRRARARLPVASRAVAGATELGIVGDEEDAMGAAQTLAWDQSTRWLPQSQLRIGLALIQRPNHLGQIALAIEVNGDYVWQQTALFLALFDG